ncbi:hypothetical protein [Streptosporangium sp. 'caverna']|uniref:hypothetical protein n=1 Tax=Streptosporangium sp. 'caverna' TaxID=2202249 RepID=UPI0013A6AB0D|nr:hypothetical protein [Streptosporangium sp. 'caverna']
MIFSGDPGYASLDYKIAYGDDKPSGRHKPGGDVAAVALSPGEKMQLPVWT